MHDAAFVVEYELRGLNKIPSVIPPGAYHIALGAVDTESHREGQATGDFSGFFFIINTGGDDVGVQGRKLCHSFSVAI